MQKVLTAAEMREVDRLTTEKYGTPSIILMENAAHAAARVITEKLGGSVKGKSFLILCGPGNNGGDGAALARILWTQGAQVYVYLFGKVQDTKGDARTNFHILSNIEEKYDESEFPVKLVNTAYILKRNEYTFFLFDEVSAETFVDIFDKNKDANNFDCVVDGIFGTGLSRPLEGILGSLTYKIREYLDNLTEKSFLVSLDIPSGLNSDLAESIGYNFNSDLTITFTAPKVANIMPPVSNFNGQLTIADIGSPQELIDNSPSQLFLADMKDARDWFRQTRFSEDSYKNKRGHSLIIAGSEKYSGAAVLTADACMRSGVGLVTLAVPKSVKDSITSRVLPEIMTLGLSDTGNGAVSEDALRQIDNLIEKIHCISIGSGLSSNEETTRKFVRKVVENRKTPTLLDADALNALSPFDLKGDDKNPLILTPHKGEMKRLLGLKDQQDLGDPVTIVRKFAQKHHVILVLKGERVLIAEPGGKVVVNPTGNSGLGKGGNGDTLAGIITGFMTQTMAIDRKREDMDKVFEAVVAAVYTAGLAGDIAERKYGKRVMTASDVRECLADAFKEIEGANA